jgi:hypothetical protein
MVELRARRPNIAGIHFNRPLQTTWTLVIRQLIERHVHSLNTRNHDFSTLAPSSLAILLRTLWLIVWPPWMTPKLGLNIIPSTGQKHRTSAAHARVVSSDCI